MVTKQAPDVAGVVRSPQLQYELSEALADADGTEPDLRIGGLKALAPDLLRGERMPGVLLLEIDLDDIEDMAALRQLSAQASRAHVPIVAIANDLDPATVRRLLRHGVADWIPQPVDRAEVLDVLRNAEHKTRRRQQGNPAHDLVLTFRVAASAGATRIAVNLAHALARWGMPWRGRSAGQGLPDRPRPAATSAASCPACSTTRCRSSRSRPVSAARAS